MNFTQKRPNFARKWRGRNEFRKSRPPPEMGRDKRKSENDPLPVLEGTSSPPGNQVPFPPGGGFTPPKSPEVKPSVAEAKYLFSKWRREKTLLIYPLLKSPTPAAEKSFKSLPSRKIPPPTWETLPLFPEGGGVKGLIFPWKSPPGMGGVRFQEAPILKKIYDFSPHRFCSCDVQNLMKYIELHMFRGLISPPDIQN